MRIYKMDPTLFNHYHPERFTCFCPAWYMAMEICNEYKNQKHNEGGHYDYFNLFWHCMHQQDHNRTRNIVKCQMYRRKKKGLIKEDEGY